MGTTTIPSSSSPIHEWIHGTTAPPHLSSAEKRMPPLPNPANLKHSPLLRKEIQKGSQPFESCAKPNLGDHLSQYSLPATPGTKPASRQGESSCFSPFLYPTPQ